MGHSNSKSSGDVLEVLQSPTASKDALFLSTSGSNLTGECGSSYAPFGVVSAVMSGAAGVNHSIVVMSDGSLAVWGSN